MKGGRPFLERCFPKFGLVGSDTRSNAASIAVGSACLIPITMFEGADASAPAMRNDKNRDTTQGRTPFTAMIVIGRMFVPAADRLNGFSRFHPDGAAEAAGQDSKNGSRMKHSKR